jgi:hypothetical protein
MLIYDVLPGTFLSVAVRDVKNLAVYNNKTVKFVFNTITLYCHPETNTEDLIQAYHLKWDGKDKKLNYYLSPNKQWNIEVEDNFIKEDEFKI